MFKNNSNCYQLFVVVLSITILAMIQGCSIKKNINNPAQLTFEQQTDILPINVGVYISENNKNKVIEGEQSTGENALSSTTYFSSNIGQSLEPNILIAFSQIFNNVIVVNNNTDMPSNIDTLIEIKIENSSWINKMKPFSFGQVNRTLEIHLKGFVKNKNKEIIKEYISKGITTCEAWECFSGDTIEGESAGGVVLKALFVPFYGYTLASKEAKLLENALSSTLQQAIQNLSEQLSADKSTLVALLK